MVYVVETSISWNIISARLMVNGPIIRLFCACKSILGYSTVIQIGQ